MSLRLPVPPLLRRLSSDEYRPLPWRRADCEALARFGDAFRAFTIPERLQERHGYPPLTPAAKEKILGLNAAAVYGVDLRAARASRDAGREWLEAARRELAARLV